MTEVKIETDVFQTWQFDFTYLKSFIERKHVTDDVVGKHTIPETLETGEYLVNSYNKYDMGDNYIVAQVTKFTDNTEKLVTDYGGIPMSGGAYICDSPRCFCSISWRVCN